MSHRSRILILTALIGLLAAPASAQRSGLEFGFPSGLGLDSIDPGKVEGYDFSWTRRDGGHRGLRLGLTLAMQDMSGEQSHVEAGSYPAEYTGERTRVSHLYALRLQKLFVSDARENVRGVFGIGPMIAYHKDESKNPYTVVNRRDETLSRAWDVGLAWDLGVEWALAPQISVGARYGWSFVYRNESEEFHAYYPDADSTIHNVAEMDGLILSARGSGELIATVWF